MENEKKIKNIRGKIKKLFEELKHCEGENTKGKLLVCQRCGYAWDYTGDADYWTSCPHCKTSVSVRQNNMPADLPAQKV